jgi:predicted CopG family antitoxin
MTDTTTIEIDREQRKELERLKTHERESIKTVMDRLLHDADSTEKVGLSDISEQLDRIEAAAKEATQTAQATHSELEGLQ